MNQRTLFLLDAHFSVKASGCYNYQGLQILLPSKFNFEFIEKHLKNYRDQQVVKFLKFGFPVDCKLSSSNPGRPANHKGATQFKDQVHEALYKECVLGGTLGPFVASPFPNARFSPLNSVPKKDLTDRRLILDMSFPASHSINDGINKDTYLGVFEKMQLPSVDSLVEKIIQLGAGCKIFKIDLSRCYKQFYIDPSDFALMGFTFEDKFFFDCTLSMGSRSSARCCQRVTSAVVFIHAQFGYFAINYLDDLGGADSAERAEAAYMELRQLLRDFGLCEAPNKSCAPTCCMVFLGIEVNTILLTLSIPRNKLQEILYVLSKWADKDTATLNEIQKLAGLLNFACRCIRSGRVYLACILNFLRAAPQKGSVAVPEDTKKDVDWWREFAPTYNGVSLMLDNHWSAPDVQIESDSSLTGGGALMATHYFHCQFPAWVRRLCPHINQLECVVLVVALNKFAKYFPRAKLQFNCDNQVMVTVVNSGASHDVMVQKCLRHMHKIMPWYSVDVRVCFIRGVDNRAVDGLSRWYLGEHFQRQFRNATAHLSLKFEGISTKDFEFLL